MPPTVHSSSPPLVFSETQSVSSASFDPPKSVLVACVGNNQYGQGTNYQGSSWVMSNNGAALTWQQAVKRNNQDAGSARAGSAIYVAELSAARTGMTVSVAVSTTSGTAEYPFLKVYVVEGADVADIIGAVNGGWSPSNAATISPSVTVEAADSLIFYTVVDHSASGAPTENDANLTSHAGTQASAISFLTGYEPGPASGSAETTVTSGAGTPVNWIWCAAEVRAAPSGPSVDAGVDVANHTIGSTFSRTATESLAGSTFVSRKWELVSGPYGAISSLGNSTSVSIDLEFVGNYVFRYTMVTNTGTYTDDITVSVQAVGPGTPAPKRLYLTNSAPSYTPATRRGAWDNTTQTIARKLSETKSGTNTSVAQAEASATDNFDVFLGRWISDATLIKSAGTLSGTLDTMVARQESSASANMVKHVHMYVTAGDSDTVRGTLVSDDIHTTEWPTTMAAAMDSNIAMGSVAVQPGDRIVFEYGYRAQNTSTTSFTGTIRYGGTNSTDLAAGTTSLTTRSPWIEIDPGSSTVFLDAVTPPTVSAGSDIASHPVGTPLSITATENDNGNAVSLRAWVIISGPAGVGTVVDADVTNNYTPTVIGTYTFRYGATNNGGTGVDDVVVTVTAAQDTTRFFLSDA